VELNDLGREQALESARRLAKCRIEAVYSSDLARALATAVPIALEHRLEVIEREAFREIDQGEWTGLTSDEIRARWPDAWGPARHYSGRPGGESPSQVRRRALEGVKAVVEEHPLGTVVVVSHGVTIRCLAAAALGYDDRASGALRGLDNGGIMSLEASLDSGALVLSGLRRLDGRAPARDDPNQ
jgi:broad specificity phosphatase PhoE